MKSFLYALKVCITIVPFTFAAFIVDITFSSGKSFGATTLPVAILMTVACMLPFLLAVWLSAALLYKKDIPVKTKKRRVALWGFLAILLAVNFISLPPMLLFLCFICMSGAFVLALRIYELPSRKIISITDGLKGRHVLLRVQENNLLLRGIVLSELNIWPITIKLQDNSPNSTLELHSMQQDELFTSLNYQTSVKVKAFTADRQEFLFAATLELDHTLN